MIPEVAAVVQAAKAYHAHGDTSVDYHNALMEAVDALLIRETRAPGGPTYEEEDRTWGEVVVQDEIQAPKTGQWYEVTSMALTKEGKVKVSIKGSTKPIIRDPNEAIRVKRGVMGDAADMFQLLWSGTTIRGAAVTAHMAESTERVLDVPSLPEAEEETEE